MGMSLGELYDEDSAREETWGSPCSSEGTANAKTESQGRARRAGQRERKPVQLNQVIKREGSGRRRERKGSRTPARVVL